VVDFLHELLRFPAGTYDDQVDAFSLIGRMLDEMMPGSKPALTPMPLDPRTMVAGVQMPMDWQWQHTTRDAILRLDGRSGRI